jgi:hypothetical protein
MFQTTTAKPSRISGPTASPDRPGSPAKLGVGLACSASVRIMGDTDSHALRDSVRLGYGARALPHSASCRLWTRWHHQGATFLSSSDDARVPDNVLLRRSTAAASRHSRLNGSRSIATVPSENGQLIRTRPSSSRRNGSCATCGRRTYLQSTSRPAASPAAAVVAAWSQKPASATDRAAQLESEQVAAEILVGRLLLPRAIRRQLARAGACGCRSFDPYPPLFSLPDRMNRPIRDYMQSAVTERSPCYAILLGRRRASSR